METVRAMQNMLAYSTHEFFKGLQWEGGGGGGNANKFAVKLKNSYHFGCWSILAPFDSLYLGNHRAKSNLFVKKYKHKLP